MWKDYFRLIRFQNVLFIGIILWVMEKWVATPLLLHYYFPEQLPSWLLALLIASFCLICAGGYVINDYFDIKIDEINRPDEVIVAHSVPKTFAMRFYQALTLLGVAGGVGVAVYLRSWIIGGLFVFVPGMLWFYSASYKRQFFVGNLIVSVLAALPPLLVALANEAMMTQNFPKLNLWEDSTIYQALYLWLGGFSVFSFLTTWIREVIKDMEDERGDREYECHTLPVVWGIVPSKTFVTLLTLFTMAALCYVWLALLPYPVSWQHLSTRYIILGLLVPFVGMLVLLWQATIPADYRKVQLLTKFIMFMGAMYSFIFFNLSIK